MTETDYTAIRAIYAEICEHKAAGGMDPNVTTGRGADLRKAFKAEQARLISLGATIEDLRKAVGA